jgi:hypothetical protein
MPGINLDDRSAWDDSALVNSWDEAVAEYQVNFHLSSWHTKQLIPLQKYHSIQRSGKRLEDVLDEGELKQLRQYVRPSTTSDASNSCREHGDLMEVEETADRNNSVNHEGAELPQQNNGGSRRHEKEAHTEVRFDICPAARSSAEEPLTRDRNKHLPGTKNTQDRRKQSRRITTPFLPQCRKRC